MLEVRYLTEHSLRGERGVRLLGFCLAHGADEFSITVMALQETQAPFADKFEDELGPFERPAARRRVIGSAEDPRRTRSIRRWTFNEASLERLLGFLGDDLFHCPPGPDGWLEDLTIYRQGELVLGLASDEREGVLRLRRDELAEVAAQDIPFDTTAEVIGYQ